MKTSSLILSLAVLIGSILGIGYLANRGEVFDLGNAVLTGEEIKWKSFTDNLEFIEYQHKGQRIKDLKNIKGIWIPTEEDFEEVYKYVYGYDMVVWQSIDGTERCSLQADGTGRISCIPHWGQEFNNAKEKGELEKDAIKGLRKGLRKNEVNADPYSNNPISKRNYFRGFISNFLKKFYVYAGVEFEDHFDVSSDTRLENHTPDTTGTGWSILIYRDPTEQARIRAESANDQAHAQSFVEGGGILYETDDTMSGADYTVSLLSVNGDTLDDTNILPCRVTDATHMYAVEWNEAASDLYILNGAASSTIDTNGGGIADGSTVELICNGSSITVEDDDSVILSATDATLSSAGKSGLGMGAIITVGDDLSGQAIDDFVVTVTAAPPAGGLTEDEQINIYHPARKQIIK